MLITGISQLVTNASGERGDLGVIHDAAVAVESGRIAWVGDGGGVPQAYRDRETWDVAGRAVLPGFVDAHTHLVFAGDRSDEFARRLRGETYEQILAAGGGIHSTVAATRTASYDDLVAGATARARRMLRGGTTTVEIKSGYGLDLATEETLLRAAQAVGAATGIGVITTFLGAHVPPAEVERGLYVDQVIEEMLPRLADLAVYCDVFVDRGAFTVEDARRILKTAAELGLGLRVHAEQLSHTGAARLAAELGAASADHLDHATAEDAAQLAAAGVVATLLPGVALTMGLPQAPARLLWGAGVTVALATDCNPGTSNIESMPLVIALACLEMGLSPEEAVWAATLGGARSLRLGDRGRVVAGALADLVVLDAPSHVHLPYRPGTDLVWKVMKGGRWVS
jgi:imidazolonepropionase